MTEIWQLEHARTRSVSPENPTGAQGSRGRTTEGTGAAAARELGQGWKVAPSINLANNATATLADLAGPGMIRHLWLTTDLGFLRRMVLRMYWDDAPEPSVEVPLGDFFCNGWGEPALVNSGMVVVAPAGGLNSYWPMPFRGRGRITLENLGAHPVPVCYQITYTEHELPAHIGYLHASWRRSRPLGHPAVHTVLDRGARPRPLCRHLHDHRAWPSRLVG